jgi:hypothetical protein
MDGDFLDLIGGIAETFGLGEMVKGALGGFDAYAKGRSTETRAEGAAPPVVYERVLTRRRELNVNDR